MSSFNAVPNNYPHISNNTSGSIVVHLTPALNQGFLGVAVEPLYDAIGLQVIGGGRDVLAAQHFAEWGPCVRAEQPISVWNVELIYQSLLFLSILVILPFFVFFAFSYSELFIILNYFFAFYSFWHIIIIIIPMNSRMLPDLALSSNDILDLEKLDSDGDASIWLTSNGVDLKNTEDAIWRSKENEAYANSKLMLSKRIDSYLKNKAHFPKTPTSKNGVLHSTTDDLNIFNPVGTEADGLSMENRFKMFAKCRKTDVASDGKTKVVCNDSASVDLNKHDSNFPIQQNCDSGLGLGSPHEDNDSQLPSPSSDSSFTGKIGISTNLKDVQLLASMQEDDLRQCFENLKLPHHRNVLTDQPCAPAASVGRYQQAKDGKGYACPKYSTLGFERRLPALPRDTPSKMTSGKIARGISTTTSRAVPLKCTNRMRSITGLQKSMPDLSAGCSEQMINPSVPELAVSVKDVGIPKLCLPQRAASTPLSKLPRLHRTPMRTGAIPVLQLQPSPLLINKKKMSAESSNEQRPDCKSSWKDGCF
ncbi:hypothetical protein T07_13630 [Trichinella nelsoni]|uniref:Uncharacterized protein n=1 Tax=Trichinella nelsoni TaxID=6336 RepID=A0A0V0RYN8_9BILA|nr:hypothetical protein T07_13630 [Trichinella nelsoni]